VGKAVTFSEQVSLNLQHIIIKVNLKLPSERTNCALFLLPSFRRKLTTLQPGVGKRKRRIWIHMGGAVESNIQ